MSEWMFSQSTGWSEVVSFMITFFWNLYLRMCSKHNLINFFTTSMGHQWIYMDGYVHVLCEASKDKQTSEKTKNTFHREGIKLKSRFLCSSRRGDEKLIKCHWLSLCRPRSFICRQTWGEKLVRKLENCRETNNSKKKKKVFSYIQNELKNYFSFPLVCGL